MSVVVTGLAKHFAAGDRPAVSDVSFAAPAGAVTALLGPSGAGKSTVLRLIAGLERPDAGSIAIDGQPCDGLPPQARGVGLVFQSYALFETMTVARNIAFGLDVRRTSRRETAERVAELLRLVHLDGWGNRRPGELSGGQRQRVALARALAVRPRVLLLDEPFGALDARVRQELREWLADLHRQTKVTTLLVTHDQNEALELAEHVVVMFDGRVAQAGPPHGIYDQPATPEVAAFLGGGSMLRGRVHAGRVAAGPVDVAAPPSATEGEAASAFVRPHDVRLSRPDEDAPDVALARIERLRRVGGYVKVSLGLATGEKMTVEMPKAELDELGVGEGDRVLVDLRAAKVFVGDYSI